MDIFGITLDPSPVSQLLDIPANREENRRLALAQINVAPSRHADALLIAAAPDLWRRLDAARMRHGLPLTA